VGPERERQVDLTPPATVDSAAFRTVVLGPAAALLVPPIQNHFDVPVGFEATQQVLVEAGFASGDKKEMSGHASPLQHSGCHSRRS
jgi:hypothetical protein